MQALDDNIPFRILDRFAAAEDDYIGPTFWRVGFDANAVISWPFRVAVMFLSVSLPAMACSRLTVEITLSLLDFTLFTVTPIRFHETGVRFGSSR